MSSFAGSRLGYGCSALVGGRTRREALRLLETAFDAGIRHYDVARLYGSGDAERILGDFAAGKREQLTIASKFGMRSRLAHARAAPLKAVVRTATRRSRRALGFVRRHARATVVAGAFSPEQMRSSLEQTRQELRVDRLDLWLLHDCSAADWLQPDLLGALDEIVQLGYVSHVGTATGYDTTLEVFERATRRPDVAQFEDTPAAANAASLRERFDFGAIVTHGAFRSGFASLHARLASDERLASHWRATLEVDVRRAELLAALVLAALLDANPTGVVLVSSGSEERIRANARVAAEPPFPHEQLQMFRALLAELEARA